MRPEPLGVVVYLIRMPQDVKTSQLKHTVGPLEILMHHRLDVSMEMLQHHLGKLGSGQIAIHHIALRIIQQVYRPYAVIQR